ncbi:MAG TPA: bifunctional diaminohydroxyphosphoribosylaminopyrimidine deaminase/5-amino-6-(5-phosphoribosylamino)uracil reductase RibD [Myxococcaceae bacterium]|nr:bifunctional diaminohydroxyphosphoribosylaminopyrimidine deaminase/5-amino-6-(5-phosphoribosylamino)uracil reductase RibD [Myxococcaceae bacterium]
MTTAPTPPRGDTAGSSKTEPGALPPGTEAWMREALAEARLAVGRTHPNPAVGSVVVLGGEIVGRGHTAPAGGPHAEVQAIASAGPRARGADLFTTLEPCDHYGRTPPCTEAILAAGIARVFAGSADPNPLVDGRGVLRLRGLGMPVWTGLLSAETDALNRPFFKAMRSGLPWVTLKAAVSLDGKLATASGDSRWVTGEAARTEVHRLRNIVDAVLVGAGTVRADDPSLTTRLPEGGGRDPLRVVLDSALQLSPGRQLFHLESSARTLLVHVEGQGAERAAALAAVGAELLAVPGRPGEVDLESMLRALLRRDVLHVLVEGGPGVFSAFLRAGLADSLVLHLAPRLVGSDGRSWLGPLGVERMAGARPVTVESVRWLGEDLEIRALLGPA